MLAASFLSFAFVLRAQLRGGAASIAAPAVLLLMTTGVVLAGAFTMDGPDATPTLGGSTDGGFLVFPWFFIAQLIVARRFRRDAGWRGYFGYTLASGLFSLAMISFFLMFVGPPELPRTFHGLAGLFQRLLMFPFFVWIALVTRRAYQRMGAASVPAPETAPHRSSARRWT